MDNEEYKNLKAIIFDFDNTLYDGPIWEAWGKHVREFIDYTFEDGDKFCKEYNIIDTTNSAEICEILIKLKGTAEEFYNYESEHIFDYDLSIVNLCDISKLNLLKNKYKLFIVSNSHINYLKYQMQRFGIDSDIFEGIYDNHFYLEDRTKAYYYKKILNDYNYNPNEVIVIGDSLSKDIKPAQKLNLLNYHVKSLNDTNEIMVKLLNI